MVQSVSIKVNKYGAFLELTTRKKFIPAIAINRIILVYIIAKAKVALKETDDLIDREILNELGEPKCGGLSE